MALDRIFAPRAKRDLEDIFHFISTDDEAAAWGVLQRIEKMTVLLAERPFLGSMLQLPAGLGLRRMSVPPYVIFYRSSEGKIEIVRILHSARDLNDAKLF